MNEKTVLSYLLNTEERLDKYLVSNFPEHSRSRLQSLIKEGRVSVDGKVVTKSGYILETGNVIEVQIPPVETTELIPEDIPLEIVFESDDLIVVNKPAGMVVHPAFGHARGTLVHAVLAHAPQMEGIGGELRPGIVHRLDKDTSGLIIVAKNDRSLRWLQDQFRLHKVEKIYLALVDGHLPTPEGRIEAPIGRDPSHRQKMAIVPAKKGREAITEYFTREVFPHHTLVEAHLLTGRTHQIRLHLSFLGCPIVGDTVYGHRNPSISIERQFLHAAKMSILLPGETVKRTFEAKLPEDLQSVLEILKK
ncbi:MAG: RluA family pseudouridine synthase [Anaerolineaceae bacterium]